MSNIRNPRFLTEKPTPLKAIREEQDEQISAALARVKTAPERSDEEAIDDLLTDIELVIDLLCLAEGQISNTLSSNLDLLFKIGGFQSQLDPSADIQEVCTSTESGTDYFKNTVKLTGPARQG